MYCTHSAQATICQVEFSVISDSPIPAQAWTVLTGTMPTSKASQIVMLHLTGPTTNHAADSLWSALSDVLHTSIEMFILKYNKLKLY